MSSLLMSSLLIFLVSAVGKYYIVERETIERSIWEVRGKTPGERDRLRLVYYRLGGVGCYAFVCCIWIVSLIRAFEKDIRNRGSCFRKIY